MRRKFPAIGVLLAAVALVLIGVAPVKADRLKNDRLKYDTRGRPYYGVSGPNVVIQQGPHTRLYVTKRSWLDAGTEVLPGERKFMDYAYPPGPSFGVENNNHPTQRQPLDPDSDLGGGPRWLPLY